MIVFLEITRDLNGEFAETALVEYCTDTDKFMYIILDGVDYSQNRHESVALKFLGGREAIVERCLAIAAKSREVDDIDAFKSVRDQREGA